jgi:uncharacterized protein with beta-barrel porin domain
MQTLYKLNERLKKIFSYFSIFTIVFGTTFGTINSANAADFDVAAGIIVTKADNNGTGGGTTAVAATDDATATGATAIFDTTDNAFEITILTGDNSEAHTITIQDDAGAAGNTFTITTLTNTANGITVNINSNMDSKGATGGTLLVADGVLLDLLTNADLDVAATIDGASAGVGLLTITGDTHDMNGDIGQTNSLALITVAGDTTEFAEEVNTTTLTITGATTSFAKAVGADTINLNAGTTAIDAAITDDAGTGSAAVVLDDGAGANVLDLGGAVTYKMNTTVQADSEGEINTTIDAVVIDGTIGTSTALIADIDLDGNTTINGNFFADLTHVAAGKTLTAKANNGSTLIELDDATAGVTFSGTSAQTSKIIDGDGAFLGVITASNAAGVTFTTEIGKTNGVDKLIIDGVASPEVIVSLDGNKIGEIDMDTDATLRLAKTITNGQTVFTTTTDMEDTDVATGSKIYMPVNLSNGQTLKLLETVSQDAALTTALNLAIQDTALIDYSAAITDTDDYTVTATNKTDEATASALEVTANDAKGIKQAYTAAINDTVADDAAEEAFKNALNQDGGFSATEDTALAKQVAPQTDTISGSTFGTKAMTGSLQGIMSNRMASLRSGDAFVTGMSAGNGMSVNSGFIQAFGTEAEQKNTTVGSGTQFGYDASSSGIALGFDGITDNGSVVGLSLSMSNTDVDGKGTGKSKNDIDSYTVSVYADKTTDAGYIEGSLTLGLNENNSSRIVNTAGLDRTYKGDYDSEQVSLKIGGGMPNAVGTGFVTPFGSVTATKISTDAYTETSTTANDSLRLRVAQDDVDSVVGTVGLKYHTILDNGGSPMISLAVNNEFGDTTINSSNTYQGGGTAFNTSTDVEELSATLGLGYSFRSDNTTLELAYEADANDDDYLGHYGSIKIVSKF